MTQQRGGARPRRPGGRRFFPRRKVCQFCVDKDVIDYKNVQRIKRFISDWGKIESRRKTGTCSPHQRQLSLAIKRARELALLPYSGSHSLIELTRFDPRGDRGRRPSRFDGPPAAAAPAATAPAADAPAADAPAADAPAADAPAADAPAAEAPVAEVAEEAPAEETPAEETPVVETPAEETPAEETPAEETPAEETPAEDADASKSSDE
ncbi:MAG: 30S ribosomal protein S18 [Dehalococcoidia bacterium]